VAISRWVVVDFAHDVVVPALARTRQHALRHAAAGVELILAQGTDVGPFGPVQVC
jgi:NAD(P)H-dependent flavin oxidoreductase YrpB (nitropropane dioxygenase family)